MLGGHGAVRHLLDTLHRRKDKVTWGRSRLCASHFAFLLSFFQEHLNRKNSGSGYSIHQHQGNKQYGTEKSGFLYKKSDG